jgi:hypothetical protein
MAMTPLQSCRHGQPVWCFGFSALGRAEDPNPKHTAKMFLRALGLQSSDTNFSDQKNTSTSEVPSEKRHEAMHAHSKMRLDHLQEHCMDLSASPSSLVK